MKEKISSFILNYIFLEGARKHFNEDFPPDDKNIDEIFDRIKGIGFPERWNKGQQDYEPSVIVGDTNCIKCWKCLEVKTVQEDRHE